MTDTEILTKAIEKATKNGWKWQDRDCKVEVFHGHPFHLISFNWEFLKEKPREVRHMDRTYPYPAIIFSHDFAKAFWGEEEICMNCSRSWFREKNMSMCGSCDAEINGRSWQYHLQQMVLEEDPVKYLERFLS